MFRPVARNFDIFLFVYVARRRERRLSSSFPFYPFLCSRRRCGSEVKGSNRAAKIMAVPGRINGMMEEDDNDVEDWVFMPSAQELSPELGALAAAAESGDVERLRVALDNWNGNVDVAVEDGDTALHLTCLYGHLPCVQLLLERGANLECKDEDGALPLHDACAGGFTEIVQLLINSASDAETVKRMLNTVDVEGDTPLHHAARGEHLETVRLLLAAGASPERINIFGKIAAELADSGTELRQILEGAAFNNSAVQQ